MPLSLDGLAGIVKANMAPDSVGDAALDIVEIFKGTNQQLASPGYQKLPGGLIFQWGASNSSASGPAAVTFPIAFPNAVFAVNVNPVTNDARFANPDNITLTGFPLNAYTDAGARVALTCRWVAIGY